MLLRLARRAAHLTKPAAGPEQDAVAGQRRSAEPNRDATVHCRSMPPHDALPCQPDADSLLSGWTTHMLRGEFERAWAIGDVARAQAPASTANKESAPPRRLVWRGTPLAGKRVLIRCYHGLGDTIHFARYVPLLRKIAASIVVAAPAALLPLLAYLPSIDRLESGDPDADEFEVEIEVMELAYALRTTLASIPGRCPYLGVPPARVEQQSARLGPRDGRLRVGMAWGGGAWKSERSIPLALLEELCRLPNIALFSLQRGPMARQWSPFRGTNAALGELTSNDMVETAAIMLNLDLVISVDTMVAHLAGALGVPVWTLLHHASDWRWLLDRDDSPWYPTMRLFRQPAPGDWPPVVEAVTVRLQAV